MATCSSSTAESLGIDKPHQPRSFSFPQREFGVKTVTKRSFQPGLFDKWPWLHYHEGYDSVLCFTCIKANAQKKLQWSLNAESAFISTGFTNWKKASERFSSHGASKCHKEAVMCMITLPATTLNIATCLSNEHQREQLENRQCFLKILSNVQFLARQCLPLRGHGSEIDSNFIQLLKLQAQDDPRIDRWLVKRTDKYTSADIQNEILKVMSLNVLRTVVSALDSAQFVSIMVDETTDASNTEQVVICLRWVDSGLEAHEEFAGIYQVPKTKASTIIMVVRDVLSWFNISFSHLRGQCYDGASSMADSRSGVATLVQQEEPRAVFTHCYGHALNLACSDSLKGSKLMKDALDIVYEIIKLIKKSPRRDSSFQLLKEKMFPASPGIRILYPTR